jgi:hypothetical protein
MKIRIQRPDWKNAGAQKVLVPGQEEPAMHGRSIGKHSPKYEIRMLPKK